MIGGPRRYFGGHIRTVFFAIFLGLFAAACRKDEKAAPPPPPAPKADPHAGLPQAATLAGQLAAESSARQKDADTISLEKLQAALQPQGITFGPTRQLMGRTHLAIYCGRADGADGVEVTVCEYPSAEAAKAGEQESNKVLGQEQLHMSRVRKKSVLHLLKKSTTPDETVQKIFAAFDGA